MGVYLTKTVLFFLASMYWRVATAESLQTWADYAWGCGGTLLVIASVATSRANKHFTIDIT